MKYSKIMLTIILVFTISNGFAQTIIKLSEPNKLGGKPLMQALNERCSDRDFIEKDLSNQQLSELLWAAYGINRADLNKHTAPTSRNIQDMDIYLTTNQGVYQYLPKEHALKKLMDGDYRSVAGKQDFVKIAAVNLIYVSDFSRAGDASDEIKTMTAATHCGFIGQNVYLYCASEGLISVFRAYIDQDKITETLNLDKNQHVIYCQSVGYAK